MRILSYIGCFLLLAACTGKSNKKVLDTTVTTSLLSKSGSKSFKPYKLNKYYTALDTGQYQDEIMGGLYAIIERDGIVDTIDRGHGIDQLGPDLYFYQNLTNAQDDEMKSSKGSLVLSSAYYTLVTNGKKSKLKDLTEGFDDYFSSAKGIDGKIYFWQLDKRDTLGTMRISAAQFDPLTNKTKSHFILVDGVETDDSGYFPLPYLECDNIVFTLDGKKKWKYSLSFN